MNVREIFQIGLFLGVLYLALSGPTLRDSTSWIVFMGAVLGLLIHYGLTNKGNRAIVNIEPGGAGWRVLIMDMILSIALLNGLLLGFWEVPLLFLSAGAILIDYSLGG